MCKIEAQIRIASCNLVKPWSQSILDNLGPSFRLNKNLRVGEELLVFTHVKYKKINFVALLNVRRVFKVCMMLCWIRWWPTETRIRA